MQEIISMTNNDKLLEYINRNGKDRSWTELADLFGIKPGYSNKQKSDYVRKLVRRKETTTYVVNEDALFHEFLEWKKANRKNKIYSKRGELPKPFIGSPDNILVIGDLHEPFCIDEYLLFCREQQERFNCGIVVFIGDIIDNAFSSYHETNPDGLSAGDELQYAIERIKDWYTVFPEAVVTIGNHDRMAFRKAHTSKLSKRWVRSLGEVLNTPNWLYVEDIDIYGVQFNHGEGGTASSKYKQYLQSVVQGHRHTESYITYVSGNKTNIFAMQVGNGVQRDSYAMAYGKKGPNPIINCGVILNQGKLPILIPM